MTASTTSPAGAAAATGLDAETLKMTLEAIRDYVGDALPADKQLELDRDDVCPTDVIRGMCSEGLGIQLLFIPEEYGGMGGGTLDVYRPCEQMARLDIGVATSVLATFLGSDPLFYGATEEQKREWLTEIAERGVLCAYGATEPEAGSDLAALRTTGFDGAALAAMSRVFARDAAQKVGCDGARWVIGAAQPTEFAAATAAADSQQDSVRLDAVRAAQAGLIADMDRVADALYGRSDPASPT